MLQKASAIATALMLATSAANGVTIQLQPIHDAFARLGHSCGGITQQIFGQGYDASGNVTGHVFAITRCGGSGRGGGYHTTTYSTWVAVTWDLGGNAIDESPLVPYPDPSLAGAYHAGSHVGGANYPTCNNLAPSDNSFTCFSVPVRDIPLGYSVQTWLHVVNQAACTAGNTAYCSYRAYLTRP
jgi:hypothetical protein